MTHRSSPRCARCILAPRPLEWDASVATGRALREACSQIACEFEAADRRPERRPHPRTGSQRCSRGAHGDRRLEDCRGDPSLATAVRGCREVEPRPLITTFAAQRLSSAKPALHLHPLVAGPLDAVHSDDCFRQARSAEKSVPVGRVEMWRGGCRSSFAVAAPFGWRCPNSQTIAPSPHPAHRTGHADFPHPALGQDITPSPTTGCARVPSDERARSARIGARVDRSRPGVV